MERLIRSLATLALLALVSILPVAAYTSHITPDQVLNLNVGTISYIEGCFEYIFYNVKPPADKPNERAAAIIRIYRVGNCSGSSDIVKIPGIVKDIAGRSYTVRYLEPQYLGLNIFGGYGDSFDPIDYNTFVNQYHSDSVYTFSRVSQVVIPSTVREIGPYALAYCCAIDYNKDPTKLRITFPLSSSGRDYDSELQIVGHHAFTRTIFSVMALPATVTHIEEAAFEHCTKLRWFGVGIFTDVVVTNDSPVVVSSIIDHNGSSNLSIIGKDAFRNCLLLDSLGTYPRLELIGSMAFDGCASLSEFPFPLHHLLHTIGDYAFRGTNFKSFPLPDSLQTIGQGAFSDCIKLTTIPASSSSPKLRTIGAWAFENCKNLVNIGTVSTSFSLNEIKEEAFKGCDKFTTFEFGNSCKIIGSGAFANTTNFNLNKTLSLTSANIAGHAFDNTNLNVNIVLNSCIVGEHAFDNTQLSGDVILNNSVVYAGAFFKREIKNITAHNTTFGSEVFRECPKLEIVTLTGTTEVGEWNFYSASMTKVIIDDSVSIGNYGFFHCEKLTTLEIGTIGKIGDHAFESCIALTGVELTKNPNSEVVIGERAFAECKKLAYFSPRSLSAPISVGAAYNLVSIGHGAFENCESLSSIQLPNKLKYIGANIFHNCRNLLDIDLTHTKIDSIPSSAFNSCSNLRTCYLSDNVKYIGNEAFFYASSLETVLDITTKKWPSKLYYIGNAAFQGCSHLTDSLVFQEGTYNLPSWISPVETIEQNAFFGCTSVEGKIVLPNTLKTIGSKAFCYCDKITSVTSNSIIPPTVAAHAFLGIRGEYPANMNSYTINFVPLYVPPYLEDDYRVQSTTNTEWSRFTRIFGIGEVTIVHFILNDDPDKSASPLPPDQNASFTAGYIYPPTLYPPDPQPEPSRTGFSFKGWFTAADNTGKLWNFDYDIVPPGIDFALYAQWGAAVYVVYFDKNAQDATAAPDPLEIEVNNTVPRPIQEPTRTGYTFVEWYTHPTGGEPFAFGYTTVKKNLTIYAHWQVNNYTVSFNPGGGTLQDFAKVVQAPYNTNVSAPAGLSGLPSYSEEKYELEGWFHYVPKDEDNSQRDTLQWFFETDRIFNDTILHARWKVRNFTIAFNANGGEPAPLAQQVAYDTKVVQPMPVRTGYKLDYWYHAYRYVRPEDGRQQDRTEVFDFDNAIKQGYTLHAQWSALPYEVIFYANDDANGALFSNGTNQYVLSATYNTSVQLPVAPHNAGYIFDGWYTEPIGGMAVNYSVLITAAAKFYAHWIPAIYLIEFETNGGTPQPVLQQVTFGEKLIAPPALTRIGYTFVGWYIDDILTPPAWGFDNLFTKAHLPDAYLSSYAHTFYARWKEKEYTVTFRANGGMPAPIIQYVAYEKGVIRPADMTLDGKGFAGWYDNADFVGEKWDFSTSENNSVTSNLILYANWIDFSYTVKFYWEWTEHPDVTVKVIEPINGDPNLTAPAVPARPGYSFGGWYTSPNGNGFRWEFSYPVDYDLELYAYWTPSSSTAADGLLSLSAEYEYYDLIGRRVFFPITGNLYIRRDPATDFRQKVLFTR